MNKHFKILSILFLLLGCSLLHGQEVKKFTYGGGKGKYKGTFNIAYFLEVENNRYSLSDLDNTIDFNQFKAPVKLVLQISALRLGLNNSFTQTKNSDHSKVFYLELSSANVNHMGAVATSVTDTIKISSEQGHFGPKTGQISYLIDQVTEKRTLLFRVKSKIHDGIYDRQWDGILISKNIEVIPRQILVADMVVDSAINTRVVSRKRRSSKRRGTVPAIQEKVAIDSLPKTESIEDKLWAKIEQDLISDNRESLLERCRIYQINCHHQIFTECKYIEDVLYYRSALASSPEKEALIAEYKKEFPQGKYIDKIAGMLVKPKPQLTPVKAELAQLDFDDKAVVVNRIKGGHQPYYVGFFDYAMNKEYAVKSIRFNKEELFIDLESLEIPEGSYTVKVVDSKGQLFLEREGVYVSKAMDIPKSVKLSTVLVFVAALGFLYKKFIHF